jgi:hypothetical protein
MERKNYWPNRLFKWVIKFFLNNCFGELLVHVYMKQHALMLNVKRHAREYLLTCVLMLHV